MCRSAAIAARRACWERRRAAAINGAVLSARIGVLGGFAGIVVEGGDDLIEADEYPLVHLGQPGVSTSVSVADQLQRLLPLAVVLREKLCGGDEHRAGQAGIGVRAGE